MFKHTKSMLWSFVYRKFPKDYVPTVFETHASKFTLYFKKKKRRSPLNCKQ